MANSEFVSWLNTKLREINTDEGVFGSYIIGILEGDENLEEKSEAIEGVLSEIIGNNLNQIVMEIIAKWNSTYTTQNDNKQQQQRTIDVDEQLARILESKITQATVQREYTADELRIREQILAQYSQLSVSEDSDVDNVEEESPRAGPVLIKNTNALDVQQSMKERREQSKVESQKKKEKDKEDREKQKKEREEKKEKRKTVKGERRR